MSELVQQRWPDGLKARVDAVAGGRGRTAFTVRALEAALGGPGPSSSVAGSTPALASPRAPGSEPRRFRCGCVTSATSPKAVCPKHVAKLA